MSSRASAPEPPSRKSLFAPPISDPGVLVVLVMVSFRSPALTEMRKIPVAEQRTVVALTGMQPVPALTVSPTSRTTKSPPCRSTTMTLDLPDAAETVRTPRPGLALTPVAACAGSATDNSAMPTATVRTATRIQEFITPSGACSDLPAGGLFRASFVGVDEPAPGCHGVVLAAGAGFEVADAAGGAGVDATALGQELA
jgi:hypothetical protein